MPLAISFLLIGFFVWLAENIATFLHGWQYPDQARAWSIVHSSKITSWFLLVIISFICVAQLKHVKARLRREPDPVSQADLPESMEPEFAATGSALSITGPGLTAPEQELTPAGTGMPSVISHSVEPALARINQNHGETT